MGIIEFSHIAKTLTICRIRQKFKYVKKRGLIGPVQIADKEGKSVVFPSLWLSAENQRIDFPCFLNGGTLYFCDAGRFAISLNGALLAPLRIAYSRLF